MDIESSHLLGGKKSSVSSSLRRSRSVRVTLRKVGEACRRAGGKTHAPAPETATHKLAALRLKQTQILPDRVPVKRKADFPPPSVEPKLTRVDGPIRSYCRAPCQLKMMSLLDSSQKHTCVLPRGVLRPAPAPPPQRPAPPPPSPQMRPRSASPHAPCKAPCPLKLASLLEGGQKHVCVGHPSPAPNRRRSTPLKPIEPPLQKMEPPTPPPAPLLTRSSSSGALLNTRRSLAWPPEGAPKLYDLGKHRHRAGGRAGGAGKGGGERERERDKAEGMDFVSDGLLTRTHLKKKVPTTLDKLPYIDIHSHALFAAIEQGHLERMKTILQTTDVDINSVNSDGLSPLDLAVLINNKELAKILIAFGAQEGNQFKNADSLGTHLRQLVLEAELRLQDLSGSIPAQSTSSSTGTSSFPMSSGVINSSSYIHPLSSGATAVLRHHRSSSVGGSVSSNGVLPSLITAPAVSVSSSDDNQVTVPNTSLCGDKQMSIWDRRARSLKRILMGFDQARVPDKPFSVAVDVTGTHSVTVRFQEPDSPDSYTCTKFKVEWSCDPDFNMIAGERQVLDLTHTECLINDLVQGQRYFFRVSCGNIKGYGESHPSSPPSVVPSSWRDVNGREARFSGGSLRVLDTLFAEMRKARPEFAAEIKDLQESSSPGGETPGVQRRKKTTIKQLFTAASKFQKNLRRGVYLSCLLYHEDKVLVTNEDFLPVIEVDETYPSCIYHDFHWLMKVACTWDDVKSLRQDMEKSINSASIHFRLKLLQAAAQMQTALCIQDLGQLYHKPIRDSQGTLVISMVNYVRNPKNVSVLNSRWLPLGKVVKKASAHEDPNVGEILMTSIQEQIMYHQVSSIRLPRGLYLGFLKLHSSVDLIQVVVPAKTPNVLPHCKIRDNPHVSAEEWEGLKRLKSKTISSPEEREESHTMESEQQQLFVDQVASAARRLFSFMEVNEEEAQFHRLYDTEIVDLSPEVSFLVIVPPAEAACAVPGQRDTLLQRGDLLSLPVQVFEMVHLASYQHNVISRYSRLSCILELDLLLAQHSLREAFSAAEVTQAKERVWKLQEIDSQLSAVKKGIRWLMDVVTFTRDRGSVPGQGAPGILVRTLFAFGSSGKNKDSSAMIIKRSLLQLPPRDPKLVKSSASRGSWPGPGVPGAGCLLTTEFSKSEQQLNTSTSLTAGPSSPARSAASLSPTPKSTDKGSGDTPRKGSAGSVSSLPMGTGLCSPSASTGSVCSGSLASGNLAKSPKGLALSRSEDALILSQPRLHSHPSSFHPRSNSAGLTTSISPPLFPIHQSVTAPGSLIDVATAAAAKCSITAAPSIVDSPYCRRRLSEDLTSPPRRGFVNPGLVEDEDENGDVVLPVPSSGILQVYAAYKTGLTNGVSLRVHVTPQTSAREVVNLVVKQLNLAAVIRGKPGQIYSEGKLENFCLVAVIGARERCLRDDFKPLQLQNPWRKGRLYVRLKNDVLAALDASTRKPSVALPITRNDFEKLIITESVMDFCFFTIPLQTSARRARLDSHKAHKILWFRINKRVILLLGSQAKQYNWTVATAE